jgi:spore coat protein U-like protein
MRGFTIRAAALAAVAAAVAIPTAANATTTPSVNLGVSATVSANCTLSTAPVAFGAVNTIGGSNVDATGGLSVTCTNGTTWSAAAGAGSGTGATFAVRKMTAGSNTLNYSLYADSGRTSVWGDGTTGNVLLSGTGTGSVQSVTVYGRVAAGQTAVPAGSYADTVAVTVTY